MEDSGRTGWGGGGVEDSGRTVLERVLVGSGETNFIKFLGSSAWFVDVRGVAGFVHESSEVVEIETEEVLHGSVWWTDHGGSITAVTIADCDHTIDHVEFEHIS